MSTQPPEEGCEYNTAQRSLAQQKGDEEVVTEAD
jgi:hypothetical protein